jgi:predicted RNase H-like HicB family nuclease
VLAVAARYAFVIEWSSEDIAFIASVPDIPGIHTHGATRAEAAAAGDQVLALWLWAQTDLANRFQARSL